MAKSQSRPETTPALGLKGYRVNLSDVKAKVIVIKNGLHVAEEQSFPARTIVAGWVIGFSGGLTWATGLHANLDLCRKLHEDEADPMVLSDKEYAILKGCVERVPCGNVPEAKIVEQILAAEQIPLAPAS